MGAWRPFPGAERLLARLRGAAYGPPTPPPGPAPGEAGIHEFLRTPQLLFRGRGARNQARNMAKKSQVNRDRKRKALIEKHAATRAALRKRLNDPDVSIEEKLEVQNAFAKLPRNSCPTRLNRRCEVTGRSKSYYRKFGVSRIALRELALRGQLPGMRKSSW
jgi:small subunit ribosomal protein S14